MKMWHFMHIPHSVLKSLKKVSFCNFQARYARNDETYMTSFNPKKSFLSTHKVILLVPLEKWELNPPILRQNINEAGWAGLASKKSVPLESCE